jgi:deaminated glutathione amidase
MTRLRVAAVQLGTGEDVEANVSKALALVDRAAADLVVLPEVFAHVTKPADERIVERVRAKARERKIWICGSLLLDGYNEALLIAPDGAMAARYRKIHLFDMPGVGCESSYMKAGGDVVTSEIGGLRVGFAICYDLRFPELFRRQRADLYLVPSAFSLRNGPDHWEVLLRARAIENLAYVVAPDQEGTLANGFRAYGHSMIVDPWGTVLAEASAEGVITADIDGERLASVRQALPALDHTRLIR